MTEDLVNLAEATELLNCSRNTLDRMIDRFQWKVYEIPVDGRGRYLRRADVLMALRPTVVGDDDSGEMETPTGLQGVS